MKKLALLAGLVLAANAYAQMVGIVQGSVLDTQGVGLANVHLKFTGIDADPPFEREITTDEHGKFTLAGLKPIEFEVYAKKEGYNDQIHRYKQNMGKQELFMTMMTMEEAYADALEKGLIEAPKEDPKADAIDFYNEAVPLYKNEDYDGAMELLSQAIEKDPELAHALKLAAYCAVKKESWKDGLNYAERFLALEPEDLNMSKLALEAARMLNDTDTESKYRDQVKEIEGVTPETLYNEAVVAMNADNDDLAAAKLNELLKLDATYAIAHYYLGHINVRAGEFEEAVKHLKQFIKIDPKHELAEEAKDLIVTLSE
ncbi:MAG: tetratricopeptide repeat protein [Acidobacteria bacterium]|nr:tetratricopeptide repeat protein [Acidobacteriota bacterium]